MIKVGTFGVINKYQSRNILRLPYVGTLMIDFYIERVCFKVPRWALIDLADTESEQVKVPGRGTWVQKVQVSITCVSRRHTLPFLVLAQKQILHHRRY